MNLSPDEPSAVPLAPGLVRRGNPVRFWTDPELDARSGVLVAFSERLGGVSRSPWATLNLAAHVGDDPGAVDENRRRLLESVGLEHARARLVTAEQVHGATLTEVAEADSGRGAFATTGVAPVPATDALMTDAEDLPLMLCFADCVPVVLVAESGERRRVAVVHAGWRGALAGLPGISARALAARAGMDVSELRAYVGPHVGGCHYEVSAEIMSHFADAFGTVSRAESGGLDLGAVVTADLTGVGVARKRICKLVSCTAEHTDSFYSYRAEGGLTGRHAALVAIRRDNS